MGSGGQVTWPRSFCPLVQWVPGPLALGVNPWVAWPGSLGPAAWWVPGQSVPGVENLVGPGPPGMGLGACRYSGCQVHEPQVGGDQVKSGSPGTSPWVTWHKSCAMTVVFLSPVGRGSNRAQIFCPRSLSLPVRWCWIHEPRRAGPPVGYGSPGLGLWVHL